MFVVSFIISGDTLRNRHNKHLILIRLNEYGALILLGKEKYICYQNCFFQNEKVVVIVRS